MAAQPQGESDPLAELARLIGQADPYSSFGRDQQGQPQRPVQREQVPHDPYAEPEPYAPESHAPEPYAPEPYAEEEEAPARRPSWVQNLTAGHTFANIVNVASLEQPALDRIKPNDPDNSYLIQKIVGAPGIGGSRMPLGCGSTANPCLDQATIDMVKAWVSQGALDN